MRTLIAVLVLANAAFFMWANGWLSPLLPAPWQGQREPGRLREQVRPASVAVARAHAAFASQPAVREAPPAASAAAAAAASASQVPAAVGNASGSR